MVYGFIQDYFMILQVDYLSLDDLMPARTLLTSYGSKLQTFIDTTPDRQRSLGLG